MCVMTIKRDENMAQVRTKSRIVVLGNFEGRPWEKSEKYAPVLQYSLLRLLTSMVKESCRVLKLKQGDCKNVFCNARLLADETTIIRPPLGDPDAKKDVFSLLKKTLYGLGRSPRHWHNLVNSILMELGIKPSLHDSCLYQGVPSSSDNRDPTCVSQFPADRAVPTDKPLHLGLYVDDFVYFSEDPHQKNHFRPYRYSKP